MVRFLRKVKFELSPAFSAAVAAAEALPYLGQRCDGRSGPRRSDDNGDVRELIPNGCSNCLRPTTVREEPKKRFHSNTTAFEGFIGK